MTAAEKKIVDAWFVILESFNDELRAEIIKRIKESAEDKETKEQKFYDSCGAWESDLTPEEEAAQLRAARNFKQ